MYPLCSNSRLTRGGIGVRGFDIGSCGDIAAGAGDVGPATGIGDGVATGTDFGMGT